MTKVIIVGEEHTHPLPPQILKYIFSGADLAKSALISEHDPHSARDLLSAFGNLVDCLDIERLTDGPYSHKEFDRKKASKILFDNFANLLTGYLGKHRDKNGLTESISGIASIATENLIDERTKESFFSGFRDFFREELQDAKSLEGKITLLSLEMFYFARLKSLGRTYAMEWSAYLPKIAELEKDFGIREGIIKSHLLGAALPIEKFFAFAKRENEFDFYSDFLPEGKMFFLKEPLSDEKPFPSIRDMDESKKESAIAEEMNEGMLSNINKILPRLDLIVVNCGASHCNYLYSNLLSAGHEVIKMACVGNAGSFSKNLRSLCDLPEQDYVTSFSEAKRRVDEFISSDRGTSVAASSTEAGGSVSHAAASRISVWSKTEKAPTI